MAHAGRPSVVAYRLVLCALAAISAVVSAAGGVEAQAYPDRLIKIVVPYPPGGPIDTTARLVVQRLGPILGQTVIIENRAGAGGALGTKAVAGAEPDGYTLLFGNASALVVGPAVYRFRDYDTVKHFTPIAKVNEGYEVLVVAPDFPANNVQSSPTPRLVPASSTSVPWATATLRTSPRNYSNCRPGRISSTSRTRAPPKRSPASSPVRCTSCSGRSRA